jgi:Polyketide cyclase / dehydrase and lipid transport
MIRVELEHRFDVPLHEGFDYITNPANWPAYWPGFVRIEPGSRWKEPGDETRLVVRLLGREVELRMTLTTLDRYRLVEYTSVQPGLPDARHERHFGSGGGGFQYRLVVEYEPRAGLRGVYDRTLVRRGVERAVRTTVESLQRELQRGSANAGDSPPR